MFRRRDVLIYAALTALQLLATGIALAAWLTSTLPRSPVVLGLLALPVLVGLAVFEARWLALPRMRRPHPLPPRPGLRVAMATTFVPAAESLEMLERTVGALVAVRYPHETWVLDEGDDERVRQVCRRLGAHHFSRSGVEDLQAARGPLAARTKYGNFNSWLRAHAFERYDVVAGFDPDHVPDPEFLDRVLGQFEDPGVGYVQAAHGYYNQSSSFIARGAAEEGCAFVSSTQMVAYAIGYPIVNGSHNLHRTAALRDVGGFADHDADDLLLTLRYRARGWRGVYVPEILALGLAPVDWPSYLGQQRRWIRSALDAKLRRSRRQGPLRPLERAVSLAHGLLPLQVLFVPIMIGLLANALLWAPQPVVADGATLVLVTISALSLFACHAYAGRFSLPGYRAGPLAWRPLVLRIAKWPSVLAGLADAVTGRSPAYTITTKIGRGRRGRRAAIPHLATAALVGCAWVAGLVNGHVDGVVLQATAAVVIAVLLAIAASSWLSFPDPYDPTLAAERLGSRVEAP